MNKVSDNSLASYPQPLNHVLLYLTVSRDVQDQPPRQVSFMVSHEHILILDVFQHQ